MMGCDGSGVLGWYPLLVLDAPFRAVRGSVEWCLLVVKVILLSCSYIVSLTLHSQGKNGFVTATKLWTTNNFFVAATKILLQQPNVLLIELNILLL